MIGLVPARGGSRGIPSKNLQTINGLPLVIHACRILADAGIDDIRVSTDDPQIAATAEAHGYEVEDRPPELAGDDVSIDQLVAWYRQEEHDSWLCVVQPTVPQLDPYDLVDALEHLADDPPPYGVAFTAPESHIIWQDGHMIGPRKQRQDSTLSREVGVRIYPPGATEIDLSWPIEPITDIDTPGDLAAVRSEMGRKTVPIRYTANATVGTGHYWRARQLADLLPHDIRFDAVNTDPQWLLSPQHAGSADLIINDTLDTSSDVMLELRRRAPHVIALEDLGAGARFADLSINALYSTGDRHGSKWSVLRPEFIGLPPFTVLPIAKSVLVSFGGTDPARLTERVAGLDLAPVTTVIVPPGRSVTNTYHRAQFLSMPHMAAEMRDHDLLICSAGRTVLEAAAVGIPTLVIAQNERETRHAHLNDGNVYLGRAEFVTDDQIATAAGTILGSASLRSDLSQRCASLVDGRGGERIAFEVERLLRGL